LAKYQDAKPGWLYLTPGDQLEAALRGNYARMREMIMGDAPIFDDVLNATEALEAEINAAGPETTRRLEKSTI